MFEQALICHGLLMASLCKCPSTEENVMHFEANNQFNKVPMYDNFGHFMYVHDMPLSRMEYSMLLVR